MSKVLLILLLSISFCTSAYSKASGCGDALSFLSENISIESVKSQVDVAKGLLVVGKPIGPETVLAYIISSAPDELKEKVTSDIEKIFSDRQVFYTNKSKSSLVKLRHTINPIKATSLRWPRGKIKSQNELDALVAKTLDIMSKSVVKNITNFSVLKNRKNDLVSDQAHNIATYNILMKFYSLSDVDNVVHNRTMLTEPLRKLLNIVSVVTLVDFFRAHKIKITPLHKEVFKKKGPQGLYKLINRSVGLELSTKYWLTHIKNATVTIMAVSAAFIAPILVDAYQFQQSEQSVSLEADDIFSATIVLNNLDASDSEIMDFVLSINNVNDTEDAQLITDFVNSVNEQP